MEDWQINPAKCTKVCLAIAFLMLFAGAFAADECTCATPEDVAAMNTKLSTVLDDSASMRRLVDQQMRRIDELAARPWATPDQIENVSQNLTDLMVSSQQATNARMDSLETTMTWKIQLVKIEQVQIFLLCIAVLFSFVTIFYQRAVKQLVAHLGTVPRSQPMTSRESDLVKQMEAMQKQLDSLQHENKKPRFENMKNVLVFFVFLAIAGAVVFAGGKLMGVW